MSFGAPAPPPALLFAPPPVTRGEGRLGGRPRVCIIALPIGVALRRVFPIFLREAKAVAGIQFPVLGFMGLSGPRGGLW